MTDDVRPRQSVDQHGDAQPVPAASPSSEWPEMDGDEIDVRLRCSTCTGAIESHRHWPEMCCASPTIGAFLRHIDALTAALANSQERTALLVEAGNWMAARIEDTLVNLAPWEYSPKEEALESWRVLVPAADPSAEGSG